MQCLCDISLSNKKEPSSTDTSELDIEPGTTLKRHSSLPGLSQALGQHGFAEEVCLIQLLLPSHVILSHRSRKMHQVVALTLMVH